ncbi:MAG: phage tail protein [Peptococcaceae bacterium]|nr:phage tail protein [Peptococcaceae bacterium]
MGTGISTQNTFLMIATQLPPVPATTWNKLIDIKTYPDMGGPPETLDTTTLSDGAYTNIPGLQTMDTFTFDCNYTLDDYEALLAVAGPLRHFAVWFDSGEVASPMTPVGAKGKFEWDGQLSVYVTGGGVNEVVGMQVSISAASVPTLES